MESREWRPQKGEYLGEISALCFLQPPPYLSRLPYLLAGTGSQIMLYDLVTGKTISSFQVFEGIRVHGISLDKFRQQSSSSSTLSFKIAVFGERRVKLFYLNIETVINSQINSHNICTVDLILLLSLPKFSHWVLDVSFLKKGMVSYSCEEGSSFLAIGCSDNSVSFWDISRSNVKFQVRCSERCLLYSMRMWGDEVEALHVASGTIYNEIIVWKVVHQNHAPSMESGVKDLVNLISEEGLQLHGQPYDAHPICRLVGHEGSIFRIAWSSNGSKLVSVSDDRSARIWAIHAERNSVEDIVSHSVGPVLFGHSARVWDCCIFDSLIITAGEDCTCRMWQFDGAQLRMIKDHIGRGIWRCLYDPNSSLLVTAGFDSAIKVHKLHDSLSGGSGRYTEAVDVLDRTEIFTLHIPNSSVHIGLVDSKSEYVRCLHFTCEDVLYVATNNGYLYHVKLRNTGNIKWTELVRVSEEVPIVCMNVISTDSSDLSCGIEDWIAVGDGKGSMTIVRVVGNVWTPEVGLAFTWSAEIERQLLGTYWCKSLGYSFIFTADPKGRLKLWRLCDPLQSVPHNNMQSCNASLIAEFVSCFGIRIMCLDASFKGEVLVCGDLRGNLILFPLLRDILLGSSVTSEVKVSPSNYFKGAHGISSVCSVAIASSSFSQIEIRSTGGDGCICCLEYDRDLQILEFIGMKQVKELSFVQAVFPGAKSSSKYAVGFASSDFKIWNLISETKVLHVACGGWRRPHSYYLGDVPEMKNCFAFVKDDIIFIHRHWVADSEGVIYPQNLHLQFHGREMHSLCFISEDSHFSSNEQLGLSSTSGWVATGCEDGTVRLTRYDPGVENWSTSKLLGEHVGGSAVRSICSVSKMHIIVVDLANMPTGAHRQKLSLEDQEKPFLLISVGAKRVITAWKRKIKMRSKKEENLPSGPDNEIGKGFHLSLAEISLTSFQWLSTNIPTKNCSIRGKGQNIEKEVETAENICNIKADATSETHFSEKMEIDSKLSLVDKYEDDWRHLAVTAFLVKVFGSRVSVCFVVVACSDATLALRALILPVRLWFDVALLVPLSSPVLVLQHVVIPKHLLSEDQIQIGSRYIIISGCTDGSIAFWDLTENVEAFMRQVSGLQMETDSDCQKRPRTGRGSQGGRWWRSLGSRVSKEKLDEVSVSLKSTEKTDDHIHNHVANGTTKTLSHSDRSAATFSQATHVPSLVSEEIAGDSSLEISKIWPLHVLNNVHQSGVNCLYVSEVKDRRVSNSAFVYNVLSGGDDQALHCLRFELARQSLSQYSNNLTPEKESIIALESMKNCICHSQNQKSQIRILSHDKIISAHSSAIKGVWTDGSWVFSSGLDQRVRCWLIEQTGKLTEHTHLIISVPEPEALDARACGRNHYQIAVVGRGMQMVEFFAPGSMDG